MKEIIIGIMDMVIGYKTPTKNYRHTLSKINPKRRMIKMNKDWKVIYPKNIEEVQMYLEHPKSHESVVLYKYRDLMFMLNPLGTGTCNTNELKLSDEFKVEKVDMKHIMIIDYGH